MDNTLKYILGGGLILLALNQLKGQGSNVPGNIQPGGYYPPGQYPYPNFPTVPPPPSTPQQIADWAAAITSTFGNVASLWQPGGPFYQNPSAPPPPPEVNWELYGTSNPLWP